ncbi:hypothetical protein Patl1_14689 [Pistacia atlantica]|uniref:Uncharacterized protein n=1 Tax=Pistacia atlantica TaxID=434234 RepID=A0ACC1AYB6_9ROSI|nr:hypothetical protein Patl1_14689 [Pistacia atlantica]
MRLEILDLGGNFLNNSIFSSLADLTSLKALHFNQNRLNGTVNVQGLELLRDLEELDLRGNQIYKFVFPKVFKGSRKLNALYLESLKNIDGSTLLESLGSISSLKKLDLSYSNFRRGTMTTQDLILDYSSLHISILQIVGAFTSLERLSMKNCKLSGILHHQGVPNFKNLKFLFNISFFQMITPMAALEILSLSTCGLTGTLLNQGLCKLKQLKELYMNNNDLRGTLPWCSANLTSLQLLD